MKSKHWPISRLLLMVVLLAACQPTPTPPSTIAPSPTTAADAIPLYKDAGRPPAARAQDLLSRMTLAEKIGQMTQVEKDSIKPEDITAKFIGSLLSGGGGSPSPNTPAAWYDMVAKFQTRALQTRLGIPLIYGVDAVHGHNNVAGATIFPHNIGLGATRDADLVQRIGRATAEEMTATGIRWNFAPVVAAPQDIRWGRTYEGYSENTDLVVSLGTALVRGLQGDNLAAAPAVLATPKHFIGDGATTWGTSRTEQYKLDQGDTQMDEATLRARFLPPYQAAVDAGALSIMASFSSWNGVKVHAQKYLLSDVLKGELGFTGFIVSDWGAIDQIATDYRQAVVAAINAGVDMNMVPQQYDRFITTLTQAVEAGDVPQARIDDAVRRILIVKFALGLFENPMPPNPDTGAVGSEAHRALAREAVRKSLVLLKNDNAALPLAKDTPLIFLAGQAANDIGTQCGGWTITWQGSDGAITTGVTLLDGIRATVSPAAQVQFNRFGKFDAVTGADGKPAIADVGIVVLAEAPYAEGVGDRADLRLSEADAGLLERVRGQSRKLVVILLSGRPLVITEHLAASDAFVAAWLPGTEGQGVADVLFGDFPFEGKTPFSWPRSNEQIPFDFANLPAAGCAAPLFPFGYGLDASAGGPLILPECPTPTN